LPQSVNYPSLYCYYFSLYLLSFINGNADQLGGARYAGQQTRRRLAMRSLRI
jgi:hypothetical protein